eukprot:TRINITY_DN2544_c0_g1_i2.p1 TRINITY_DN2544_c0_g1~~TRINITY_DN2544_c0_g1_i2.p1  ORF type:complete len:163 (-),score=34.76 TRINITY_DN2544_c0_g1_i2:408-896(-)
MARKYKYEDIVKLVEYQEILAKPVHHHQTNGEGLIQFAQFYRLPSLSDCQPRRFQTELVLEGSLFPKENYLKFIPQAKGDFESIVCSLEEYSKGDPVLYPSLMDQLRIRFECLSKKNISLKSAQSRALLWAYTSPFWIYQEINQKLQADSQNLSCWVPLSKD